MTRSSRTEIICKMVYIKISQNSSESTCARGLEKETLAQLRISQKKLKVRFIKEYLSWESAK